MSAKVLWISAWMAATAAAAGGNITGAVRAQGKPGTDGNAGGGKYDSRQYKYVERLNYAEMKDFVIFIDGPVASNVEPPSHPAQVVTQRVKQQGAVFMPHVLPVMVGTTVEWPNEDDILHNVFSISDPAQFDLGLYKRPYTNQVPSWKFDKPGRADVFCSIHTRMSCIVMVLENPFFAVSTERGTYSIRNVPSGTYKLKAWHERMPSQVREITVPETGELKVDFVLSITGLPKP